MSYSIAVPIETHVFPEELQQRMLINSLDHVEIKSIYKNDKDPTKYKYSIIVEEDCDYWELTLLFDPQTLEIEIIDTGARYCNVFPYNRETYRFPTSPTVSVPNVDFEVSCRSKYSKSQLDIRILMSLFFRKYNKITIPVRFLRQ